MIIREFKKNSFWILHAIWKKIYYYYLTLPTVPIVRNKVDILFRRLDAERRYMWYRRYRSFFEEVNRAGDGSSEERSRKWIKTSDAQAERTLASLRRLSLRGRDA